MRKAIALFVLSLACIGEIRPQNLAGDMALSKLLIEGEDWQEVAAGYQFTDSACADAKGNFYFTDVAKGTNILRISPDGKLSAFIRNTPRLSGLKFGPDGRLYGCTQNPKKQVVRFEGESGTMSVLADDVQPNDLVVTHKGGIYFTETAKRRVTYIDPKGQGRPVDVSITAPNGLTLSPDQGTLIVSDFRGTNLWAFRIENDGSLSGKAPYISVQTPLEKPDMSSADGMTTDSAGRYYVCTAVGLQMIDSTGRFSGVIARPQNKFMANVAFAGPNLEYLYVTCSDKVYRRKTQGRGVLFFEAPTPAKPQ